jgi:hypothetical protein
VLDEDRLFLVGGHHVACGFCSTGQVIIFEVFADAGLDNTFSDAELIVVALNLVHAQQVGR